MWKACVEGESEQRVSCPFLEASQQLRRREAGTDSQALIQWRIPSPPQKTSPATLLLAQRFLSRKKLHGEGESSGFSHETWRSSHLCTHVTVYTFYRRDCCETKRLCDMIYLPKDISLKHPSFLFLFVIGHMAYLAPRAGVLKLSTNSLVTCSETHWPQASASVLLGSSLTNTSLSCTCGSVLRSKPRGFSVGLSKTTFTGKPSDLSITNEALRKKNKAVLPVSVVGFKSFSCCKLIFLFLSSA